MTWQIKFWGDRHRHIYRERNVGLWDGNDIKTAHKTAVWILEWTHLQYILCTEVQEENWVKAIFFLVRKSYFRLSRENTLLDFLLMRLSLSFGFLEILKNEPYLWAIHIGSFREDKKIESDTDNNIRIVK